MKPNVFYDKDVLDQWKLNMPIVADLIDFRPLPHNYKSNWRVLHIDGFESRTIQFFRFLSAGGFDIPAGATVTGLVAELRDVKQD